MGTGSTLALLPPENATGNFVKVVQRLPVRIEVMNYDPEKAPLFIGLSVTPHVRIYAEPSGPNAGQFLQPFVSTTPLTPASGESPPTTDGTPPEPTSATSGKESPR
jgi:membrane fusion protein (multidrug efflux system)